MTTREELKKEVAREDGKKLIAQGWRRTEEVWTKKRFKAVPDFAKVER